MPVLGPPMGPPGPGGPVMGFGPQQQYGGPYGQNVMSMHDQAESARKMHDYEALCHIINQWNANRLDLFALTLPNEHLEFHGVMRFYYQSADMGSGQKVATKCIRVASVATTRDIIETLIEKFRPDMRMLEVPEYALYEIHESGERKLGTEEKPLLVQLNWHKDDREGRFLLRRIDEPTTSQMTGPASAADSATNSDPNFKRKLSKREKKEMKKAEKAKAAEAKNRVNGDKENEGVAEKLYTELPDTSFTRSISNPEAVMRRRRQQKLEKKLQQYRSRDGGPDTGGTLKIYGESLCKDVPYKTLLLSVRDPACFVVEEMLEKYGLDRREAQNFCLVQISSPATENNGHDQVVHRDPHAREYFLEDDECPLAILMNHPPSRGNVTFHVRRRPSDHYPRKRKKKPGFVKEFASESALTAADDNMPFLLELNVDGSEIGSGRLGQRFRLTPNVTEIGCDQNLNGGQSLVLPPGPYIRPRHCVIANTEPGLVTVTPSHPEAETYVNGQRIAETTILAHGSTVRFGRDRCFRLVDPLSQRFNAQQTASAVTLPADPYANYAYFGGTSSAHQHQQKDNILPAVLEFREETEEAFFSAITVALELNSVQFKLAPTYTIYMATRFRASTHYRPELVPEERAVRLTDMLVVVSEFVFGTVENGRHDPTILAFWMANASELLHFLKSDRHITAFSLQAQDVLAETVHIAFKFLVVCLSSDLDSYMPAVMSIDAADAADDDEAATAGVMRVLGSAMSLLRRCRVNAALTIQLFSQLFHFINMSVFNRIVVDGPVNYCTHRWGLRIKKRMGRVEQWAEKQGLELAADCHLARVVQAAHLLMARKNTAEDIASVSSICFKLNSVQLRTLLDKYEPSPDENPISRDMIDTIVRVAENTVDELTAQEGRDVRLEEDRVLQLPFLLPEDGYSCDIVRGVPGGLTEFLAPLQRAGLCVMTPQPTSSGFWTIYMDAGPVVAATPVPRSPDPSEMSHADMHPAQLQHMQMQQRQHMMPPPPPMPQEPEVHAIKLVKANGGMGLSIVAAKGVGKDRLGIYVKAVVEGGAAFHDGRLAAGDQLLTVDGQSLVGITQERAAEIMMHTTQVVELEVAKQGAIFHGLATLLAQPSPVMGTRGPHMAQAPHSFQAVNGHQGPPQVAAHGMSGPRLHGPHSRSVPALQAEGQHLYQNHRPALVQQHQPRQQLTPTGVNGGGRSASVQNLPGMMGAVRAGAPLNGSMRQYEDQGYYQNIGPNGSTVPNLQQPMPLRYNQHQPPQRYGSQTSLQAGPARSPPSELLHHASPRIIGTPMSSNGQSRVSNMSMVSPVGPEKPQRLYSHEDPSKANNNINSQRSHSQQQGRGVRFQDPKEMATEGQHKTSDINSHLEQLRLSSVEREFRKRIAEYNRNDGDSASETDEFKVRSMSNGPATVNGPKLENLRRLEAGEEAKTGGFSPGNDPGSTPPPPLPDAPPPPETPSGAQRLDALIGASEQQKSHPVATKKVSFVEHPAEPEPASQNDGKLSRLEMVEKDPNAFISEAESLLNSSSMALEKFDFNKTSGHTPSVIGAQEIYRDPRQKMMQQKADEEKATTNKRDGAKLSFKEKMELFASESGNPALRDKAKISRAQREIDEPLSRTNSFDSIS